MALCFTASADIWVKIVVGSDAKTGLGFRFAGIGMVAPWQSRAAKDNRL
jgi:hypothetical protein